MLTHGIWSQDKILETDELTKRDEKDDFTVIKVPKKWQGLGNIG